MQRAEAFNVKFLASHTIPRYPRIEGHPSQEHPREGDPLFRRLSNSKFGPFGKYEVIKHRLKGDSRSHTSCPPPWGLQSLDPGLVFLWKGLLRPSPGANSKLARCGAHVGRLPTVGNAIARNASVVVVTDVVHDYIFSSPAPDFVDRRLFALPNHFTTATSYLNTLQISHDGLGSTALLDGCSQV